VHDFFFFRSPAEIQAEKEKEKGKNKKQKKVTSRHENPLNLNFLSCRVVALRQHSYVVSVQSKSTQRESAGLADS